MVRRKKQKAEGAPEWMVTYGDMMTLLFCFFVILVSMSEIKEDERFDEVLESIKRAFGYKGGAGSTPGDAPPTNTFDKRMTQIIMRKFQLQVGKSSDEGIEGENPSVKNIRDGMEFSFGGLVKFESGRARLLGESKSQLKIFSEEFKGLNTKIRVRGHAARKPLPSESPFADLDELTYARAKAVKEYLVKDCGIRTGRITVEACGANEPLAAQAYGDKGRAINRRVSIVITENLVQQYQGQVAQDNETELY